MSLAAAGNCSYGLYTFSAYMETMGIQSTPHYDQAGRTIAYWTHVLTLKDRIFPAYPFDVETQMASIRDELMYPGQALTYSQKGFGDLTINVGAKKDVKYGPSPKGFSWRPTGRENACEIIWTVETNIPQGCTNANYAFALMSVNYSVDYVVDRDGYSTRTMAGYIEIPVTRVNGGATIPDNGDAYFEKIIPQVPPGFRPTDKRRFLSEDKRRLNFSITHEEMPLMPLPAGVTEVDATHSIRSNDVSFATWTGAIRATYQMSRDVPKNLAFDAFMSMALDRISASVTATAQGGAVIPVSFSAEEDIFGRNAATFMLAYTWVFKVANALNIAQNISQGVQAGGLWRPVPGASWNLWSTSLSFTAFAPRGYAGLKYQNTEDVLIDLCSTRNASLQSEGFSGPVTGYSSTLTAYFPQPSADTSWLSYNSMVTVDADPGLSQMKTLPQQQGYATSMQAVTLDGLLNEAAKAGIQNISGQTGNLTTDIIQQRTTPDLTLWLEGSAARVGYPIDPPEMLSVGGVNVIPAGGTFRNGTIANFGYPVYGAAWKLKFILPQNVPSNPPVMPNPGLQTPGS